MTLGWPRSAKPSTAPDWAATPVAPSHPTPRDNSFADGGSTRRFRSLLLGCGVLFTALCATGCARGVKWQIGRFEDAYNTARQSGKLTFVYFRAWYLVECTDFEENVLKNPEVLAETDRMVCVPLSYEWDQPLAGRWGLTTVPAYAIVAPTGEALARRQTPLTKDDLLGDLRAARRAPSSATRPAAP